MQKSTFLNGFLGSLQAIKGLSALLGGYMLITDPSGKSLDLNVEWLQTTPFPNYLIPGIVLFLLIGVTNGWGMWFIFNRKENRAAFETLVGLFLLAWIIAQVIWIGYKDFLQPLYFATGLLQTFSGLALTTRRKKI